MQDPTTFQSLKPHLGAEEEHLQCPRCDSTNTKFCYYNNYNLSQPRYFCRNCRRYWTKGGSLRNIPVGGGTRKNKQRTNPKRPPCLSPSSAPPSAPKPEPSSSITLLPPAAVDQDRRMLDITGSFSALLNSNGQFESLFESMNSATSSSQTVQFGDFLVRPTTYSTPDPVSNHSVDCHSSNDAESSQSVSQGEWSNANVWPHLTIYTSSNLQ